MQLENQGASSKPATLRDVAQLTGFSTATVSNVIQGKRHLYTPETARRVLEAVRDLDYRPNRIARSLVRQRTHTLGVVVDRHHGRFTRNAFLTDMVDGFLEWAIDSGYQIKIISIITQDYSETVQQIEDGSTDGVVLFAPAEKSCLMDWASQTRLPLVMAGSVPNAPLLTSIDVDDEEAEFTAVSYVIHHGHRRIGMITGPAHQFSSGRRLQGYRKALCHAGVELNPDWIQPGDYTMDGGERDIALLLDRCPDLTAVVCSNDGIAIGALCALNRRKIRVPQDLSLIGFDDGELTRWTQPALTTMHQPLREMGIQAAQSLIAEIETGQRNVEKVILPAVLVERESVSCISSDS